MAAINISFFAWSNKSKTHVTCQVRQNSSLPIPGIDIYEGIPMNLVLNIIVWLILLICFTILRKVAWDYGRIALLSRNDDLAKNSLLEQNSTESTVSEADNCWWICSLLRLKDAEIIRRCGRDAYIYLLFQRYLIAYVCLISFLSLVIILPINLSGNYFSNNFGSLTIANSKTEYLWIHCTMALLYLLLAIIFMQRFSYSLQLIQEKADDSDHQQNSKVSRTLMISNINNPNEEIIGHYLRNRYPGDSVVDIQFTYDVAALTKMDAQRQWATRAKLNSERQCQLNNQNDDEAFSLYPYPCGWLCGCCFCQACGCHKANAVEFYSELEEKLQVAIEKEKNHIRSKPLGIVFMTMRDSDTAENVCRDFCKNWGDKNRDRGSVNTDPSDTVPVIPEKTVSTESWRVQFAPAMDNIIWENLSIFGHKWWLRAILINITLLLVCIFFTTPVILLDKVERLLHSVTSSVLDKFMPTVLLWLFACLLPTLVYYADQVIGHWTRYSEHRVVMTKTFIFLVLMVIILPSLGLTSVQGFWESKIEEQYQCIFATDNVAFFVNYVVTSAFIGTGLELLRLPELIFYGIRIMFTRSSAERSAVREARVYDFHFGFQYAWLLCITAVILTYNVPFPLMAPLGLIYFITKHSVDRYNIYFAYRPLRVHIDLHTSAGTLFVAAAIFVPVCVLAFISLRISDTREFSFIFAVILLVIAFLVFVDHVRFGLLKRLTITLFNKCSTRTVSEIPDIRDAGKHVPYVAPVLFETNDCTPDPSCANTARKGYGAIVDC